MINCTSKICGELRPAVQASHEHATLARSIKTAHAQFLPELLACCQAICAKFRLQKFDFVQTKFCRDFAAKHVDLDADLAFVEIDLFHRTDGTFHCAGSDLDIASVSQRIGAAAFAGQRQFIRDDVVGGAIELEEAGAGDG